MAVLILPRDPYKARALMAWAKCRGLEYTWKLQTKSNPLGVYPHLCREGHMVRSPDDEKAKGRSSRHCRWCVSDDSRKRYLRRKERKAS